MRDFFAIGCKQGFPKYRESVVEAALEQLNTPVPFVVLVGFDFQAFCSGSPCKLVGNRFSRQVDERFARRRVPCGRPWSACLGGHGKIKNVETGDADLKEILKPPAFLAR